jgi:hypothetical protein
MDIYGRGVLHMPVVADLNVRAAKVSYTITSKNKVASLNTLRENAIAGALQEQKADVLVEPSYTVERKRGTTTVTVTGWVADYKNFRNMDTTDLPLFQAGNLHRAQTITPAPESEKPKSKTALIITAVLTGVILLISSTIAII